MERESYLLYIFMLEILLTVPRQVLMGAASVNSNGTVVSRIGSAAVAMMADAAGVPVIICCETYKFSNKVMT